MSSSIQREPLEGTIRQDQKIIGAICLPEERVQDFVDQFNRCYGAMRMHISVPAFSLKPAARIAPVGANRKLPIPVPGYIPPK